MHGGRISRGWHLSKLSWNVIQSDRSLLVLPILQCVAMLVAAAGLFVPAAYSGLADDSSLPFFVACILWAFPATCISTFFGVAFMSVAQKKLSGEPATLRDGLTVAFSRQWQIIGWALLTTLFGAAIRLLERVRGGFIAGRIAEWLLGATWALATFFVVPILALEGPGPIEATRRSARMIRKRWGEGVVGTAAIGAAFGILFIPVAILIAIGFSAFHGARTFSIVVFALAGVLGIVIASAESAVSQIFHLELYAYATTGTPLGIFDEDELEHAFGSGRLRSRVSRFLEVPPTPLMPKPVAAETLAVLDERELDDLRTRLVDELRRVGLVGPSGLLVHPVDLRPGEGGPTVTLEGDQGESWNGPVSDALLTLRVLPSHAGRARFWLAFGA